MSLPLEPYTVIDLTRARSGPTCVRQLADMGARVIQVWAREDSGGDFPRRGFDSLHLHRNKRSMSAPRMPCARKIPAVRSATGMPTRTGPCPGSPVTDMSPPMP